MSIEKNVVGISTYGKMPMMRTLLFAHRSKTCDMVKVWKGDELDSIPTFEIDFDTKETDYWFVCWENQRDNALFYTTPDPSFLQKMIKDIEHDLEKALKDALNDELEGLGTLTQTACELLYNHLDKSSTKGWIKHDLNSDSSTSGKGWHTDYSWNHDREHTEFNNGGHVTKTDIKFHAP